MAKLSLKQSRTKRIEIIDKIEKKRKSKLITYITNDRFGLNVQIAEDIICKVHKHLINNKVNKNDNLDLFIYSRGGDADVPWALVSMIREYVSEGFFNVIIPYRAHSAATVISLGADKIIMSKKGELGPIDATTIGPHNPYDSITKQKLPISVEDVNGYFNLIDKLKLSDKKNEAFNKLTDKIDPLAIGMVHRILEQTKLVATRLMQTRKDKLDKSIIENIVSKVSSEIYSHRHTISRSEAIEYLGLKNVRNTEDENIDKEVWDLYENYLELFEFETPFTPDQYLLDKNLDEYKWNGINLACIESKSILHLARKDVEVKKIKNIPNQVNLNLNNASFPQINISQKEDKINMEQIQQAIQNYFNLVIPKILSDLSNNVTKEFLKSLPNKGFQKTDLNSKWIEIK